MDLRNLSREAVAKARRHLGVRRTTDSYEAIRELHRSRSISSGATPPRRQPPKSSYSGEERVRHARWERLVADRLARDLSAGQSHFPRRRRGRSIGGTLRAVAQEAVADTSTRSTSASTSSRPTSPARDVLAVLHADNLDGIHADLRAEGIGTDPHEPQGEQVVTDQDPLLAFSPIRDRAAYGNEATGKHLETVSLLRRSAHPSRLFKPYSPPVSAPASSRSSTKVPQSEVVLTNVSIKSSERFLSSVPHPLFPPFNDEVPLDVRADLAERLGTTPWALIRPLPPINWRHSSDRHSPDGCAESSSRVIAGLRGVWSTSSPNQSLVAPAHPRPDRRMRQAILRAVTTTAQSWI